MLTETENNPTLARHFELLGDMTEPLTEQETKRLLSPESVTNWPFTETQ